MDWKELPNIIIDYSPILIERIKPINFGAMFFSIFLFISIIILIIKSQAFLAESWFMTFKGTDIPKVTANKIRRKWQLIKRRLESRQESQYKMAVIEADKLLDNLLERSGYSGDTMADKLKKITPAQIANLDSIWRAHKLRNVIVHDIDRPVAYDEAKKAIDAYEKTLDDLEVL